MIKSRYSLCNKSNNQNGATLNPFKKKKKKIWIKKIHSIGEKEDYFQFTIERLFFKMISKNLFFFILKEWSKKKKENNFIFYFYLTNTVSSWHQFYWYCIRSKTQNCNSSSQKTFPNLHFFLFFYKILKEKKNFNKK